MHGQDKSSCLPLYRRRIDEDDVRFLRKYHFGVRALRPDLYGGPKSKVPVKTSRMSSSREESLKGSSWEVGRKGGAHAPFMAKQCFFALRQICLLWIWLPAGTQRLAIGQILKLLALCSARVSLKWRKHLRLHSIMFCLKHQVLSAAAESGERSCFQLSTLPLRLTLFRTWPFFLLFCEPVSGKSHPVPKIQAMTSAQDVTSKAGLSPIPRPDQKASRLLIFWITHLENFLLSELSSLSQTKLSLVSCSESACQPASRQKLWNIVRWGTIYIYLQRDY